MSSKEPGACVTCGSVHHETDARINNLESALCALRAMVERMAAGEVVTPLEYGQRRSAVIVRAGVCARAGLGDVAIAARDEVDALPSLPEAPDARINPHVCGASNCILRPHGAPRPMGVDNCRCLDDQLPGEDRMRVRAGIRWLAEWAGKGLEGHREDNRSQD